ncbi:MAG: hypothetical protein SFU27_06385 [Thermonemataceae bacterium]|nr:hypothetical protein [Thermonemataceae bacterium]
MYYLLAFVRMETVVHLSPPCTNAFPLGRNASLRSALLPNVAGITSLVSLLPSLRFGHFAQQGIYEITKKSFASLLFFVNSQIPATLAVRLKRHNENKKRLIVWGKITEKTE